MKNTLFELGNQAMEGYKSTSANTVPHPKEWKQVKAEIGGTIGDETVRLNPKERLTFKTMEEARKYFYEQLMLTYCKEEKAFQDWLSEEKVIIKELNEIKQWQ